MELVGDRGGSEDSGEREEDEISSVAEAGDAKADSRGGQGGVGVGKHCYEYLDLVVVGGRLGGELKGRFPLGCGSGHFEQGRGEDMF